MENKKPVKKPYWYKTTIEECVLCGWSDKWRERMYTEKPKEVSQRYIFNQTACDTHFI